MATSDIINRLDRDLFKDPKISQDELFRRLTHLVEILYTIISQTEGSTTINTNIQTYNYVESGTGITINRVVFDVNGNTVEAKFENGKLVA